MAQTHIYSNIGSSASAQHRDPTDADLVQRAAEGDRLAIEAIWERYRPLVRSVLLSVLGADQEIDDLVQEVFLALFSAVKQTRDGAALPAILSKIATRRAGMILRRRKVRSIISLLPGTQPLPEIEVWPPDADDAMAVSALYVLFDRVKARPRMAFLLHHVQGMRVVDVADALGVSLSVAKRAITEGRHRIVQLARTEPRLLRYLPPALEAKNEP